MSYIISCYIFFHIATCSLEFLVASGEYREMVVVHPDKNFLDDISGKLREVRIFLGVWDSLQWFKLLESPVWGELERGKIALVNRYKSYNNPLSSNCPAP